MRSWKRRLWPRMTGGSSFWPNVYAGVIPMEDLNQPDQGGSFLPAKIGQNGGDGTTNYKAKGYQDLELLTEAKQLGFSDREIAKLTGATGRRSPAVPLSTRSGPVYKMVDTCAAEFEAVTPYFYSCYEQENEAIPYQTENRGDRLRADPDRPGD